MPAPKAIMTIHVSPRLATSTPRWASAATSPRATRKATPMAASDSNTTGTFTNGWEIDGLQVNQGEPFTVGASAVNEFYRVRRLPNP